MTSPTLDSPETSPELLDLRQQAPYWRAQHARAVEREQYWKQQAQQLEAQVRQQATQLQAQAQQMETLSAQVAWLQQQVFGRKSEETKAVPGGVEPEPCAPPSSSLPPSEPRRRGKQAGTKGYGRRRRKELPTEEIVHPLPEAAQHCPQCGKRLDVFPGTEDSEEIHGEVRVIRRVHKRRRYHPTCRCRAVPGIVTAPVPAKLIPKGMFSTGFWVQLLLEKFLFQRPLYRIGQRLALEGLNVSQGTLTGGLQRLGALLQPLYGRILERSRAADHWKMDETRWMVFAEVEGKEGHQWWLWVVLTGDTCAYLLDPSRSSAVPQQHLGEAAEGLLNVDRYAAYKALGAKIRLAFCWSHIRRDFVRIEAGYKTLRHWAEGWVQRINGLFHQNKQRLAVRSDGDAFAREDQLLRAAVRSMEEAREREPADETLHPQQKKVLESLRTHWDGAILFVDHPDIPMDNNESERYLRNPVVGRKNYYGSGAVWSGLFAAMSFTVLQTYLRNHIDPQQFLRAYFEACAQHGGLPPEALEAWLPWNLSEEQKRAWCYPKQPP